MNKNTGNSCQYSVKYDLLGNLWALESQRCWGPAKLTVAVDYSYGSGGKYGFHRLSIFGPSWPKPQAKLQASSSPMTTNKYLTQVALFGFIWPYFPRLRGGQEPGADGHIPRPQMLFWNWNPPEKNLSPRLKNMETRIIHPNRTASMLCRKQLDAIFRRSLGPWHMQHPWISTTTRRACVGSQRWLTIHHHCRTGHRSASQRFQLGSWEITCIVELVLHRFAWRSFQKLSWGTQCRWNGTAPEFRPKSACRATGLTEFAGVLGAQEDWFDTWEMRMEWGWNELRSGLNMSQFQAGTRQSHPSNHPSSPISPAKLFHHLPRLQPLRWIDPLHLRWGWKNSKASTLDYFGTDSIHKLWLQVPHVSWTWEVSVGISHSPPKTFPNWEGFWLLPHRILTAKPTCLTTSASWSGSHRRAVGLGPTDPRPRARDRLNSPTVWKRNQKDLYCDHFKPIQCFISLIDLSQYLAVSKEKEEA